ncbi:DHA1 family bicyclomycin/chloramphenicol resistance-like MFS transporter [Bradyrhizobium sp. USDA 4538]|uniref:MFS transporter n=1 Tax=unclassified Bradyrhizobium TaxID=2631580 RepID=UPI00209DD938|nr:MULTISPECIES: MFS transporter [unclassified Bradyrhizobium]MCP1845982.1 DHA1 family bicyclomycin/chloramphenicol resistance-like MFS transporter [Bradyrhizobium sp. USDA 4538]MCP1907384.1 DHA1 family bicyclomycin/chloramphenicol resistance-like MFS transporter [Bradyrhizobium sp. USDA 4537]MCP1985170.1 DHA1 family bicyclomycin/chloramphenicol resistance-like MFS transporter [Bradyrhizobium sp. USDA 4539]
MPYQVNPAHIPDEKTIVAKLPRTSTSYGWILGCSVFFASFSQLAAYICVPAVPLFSYLFPSDQGAVAISTYLLFSAVGQLTWGAASDRSGRFQTVLWGALLGTAGTLLCIFATTWQVLVCGRALQALGFSACLINSRSILRDWFDGDELTRAVALCSVWISVAPILTPLAGGALASAWGWRAPFVLTLLVTLFLLALSYSGIRRDRVIPSSIRVRDAFATCFKTHTVVWGAALGGVYCMAFGAYMANAPDLAKRLDLYEPIRFGIALSLLTPFFILGALVVRRWPRMVQGSRILLPLTAQMLCALFSLWWLANGQVLSPGNVICMAAYAVLQGVVLPVIIARTMSDSAELSGTASSLFSAMQMAGGALGAWWAHTMLFYYDGGIHVVAISSLALASLLAARMELKAV